MSTVSHVRTYAPGQLVEVYEHPSQAHTGTLVFGTVIAVDAKGVCVAFSHGGGAWHTFEEVSPAAIQSNDHREGTAHYGSD